MDYSFLFNSEFQRQAEDNDYTSDYENGDYPEQDEDEAALGLPNNSKSIRENIISDAFSCEGRPYGECKMQIQINPLNLLAIYLEVAFKKLF